MKLLFFLYLMFFGFELIASIDIEDPVFQDPGVYYAKSQVKSRRRLKNRPNIRFKTDEGDLAGSYSNKKKSKLKYAFLQPQEPPQVDIDSCKTPGTISAFQFMNFALAAATLAGMYINFKNLIFEFKIPKKKFYIGNMVANANSNNRNNVSTYIDKKRILF